MKRVLSNIFLSLCIFSSCGINDSEEVLRCNFIDYKYYQNEKQFLGIMSGNYIVIGSDTSNSDDAIKSFLKSNDYFDHNYNYTIEKYSGYRYKQLVQKFKTTQNCLEITEIMNELKKNKIVDYCHYTIKTDDCTNAIDEKIGDECVDSYSSLFYVKLKDTNEITVLDSVMSETNIVSKEQNSFMKNWYTLIADKYSKGDALEMANYFYETGLFDASEPDIIKIVVKN